VLSEVIVDKSKLSQPVDDASFADDAAPLFAYLDELHPNLWRSGKAYPQNYPDMKQKLADGELDIIFAFQPVRGLGGNRRGRTARYRAFLHLSRGHARQHAILSPSPTTPPPRQARWCWPIS
jgi:ABC-type uncharacterized transport system YnjBCD substrate-binding protein